MLSFTMEYFNITSSAIIFLPNSVRYALQITPGSAMMRRRSFQKPVQSTCDVTILVNALLWLKGKALKLGLLVTWLLIVGLFLEESRFSTSRAKMAQDESDG